MKLGWVKVKSEEKLCGRWSDSTGVVTVLG